MSELDPAKVEETAPCLLDLGLVVTALTTISSTSAASAACVYTIG